MPITLTTSGRDLPGKLRGLVTYADRRCYEFVADGSEYGQRRMRELVPRDRGRLFDAVQTSGPTVISPGHHAGDVHVDPVVAPHARDVDEGTGVDGPFKRPVSISRPSRSGKGRGAMRFVGSGGEVVFRSAVKVHPSSKIEEGKNFSGKTYDSLVLWSRERAERTTADLAFYFARHK